MAQQSTNRVISKEMALAAMSKLTYTSDDELYDTIHDASETFKIQYAKTLIKKYNGFSLDELADINNISYDFKLFYDPNYTAPGVSMANDSICNEEHCTKYQTHLYKLRETCTLPLELIRSYIRAVSYGFTNSNDLAKNVRIPSGINTLERIARDYEEISNMFVHCYDVVKIALDKHR